MMKASAAPKSQPRTVGLVSLLAPLVAVAHAAAADPDEPRAGADEPRAGAAPARAEAPIAVLSGLRRLTSHEYENTIRDLLGDRAPQSHILPPDRRTPFDNDYTGQVPSKALVEGADLLARGAAARLAADRPRLEALVGCKPHSRARAKRANPTAFPFDNSSRDRRCFRGFLARFGRRALRRPLSAAEIARYERALLAGREPRGFYDAVKLAVQAFLQHGELLYKVETGTPVAGAPGVYRLTDWQVAARLAYFLWASPPDDRLLDDAHAGALGSTEGMRTVAARMLDDPRAREVVLRFFAQWLDHEELKLSEDAAFPILEETRALLSRVIFEERRPWQDLLRADETYVTDTLARQYGLPPTGSDAPRWVSYGTSGRKGILSHGTFLAAGAKFSGETSPTLRGLLIRERLLCEEVPPPPPGVNSAEPPPATEEATCKEDRYHFHKEGGCAKCHRQMDPIGFGLERYDQQGRYRTREKAHPACEISGVGELVGVGEFRGPAGLADALLKSGRLNQCVVTQAYRFAMGRTQLNDEDQRLIAHVVNKLGGGAADFRFQDLLLELVSSEAFRHRREEGSRTP